MRRRRMRTGACASCWTASRTTTRTRSRASSAPCSGSRSLSGGPWPSRSSVEACHPHQLCNTSHLYLCAPHMPVQCCALLGAQAPGECLVTHAMFVHVLLVKLDGWGSGRVLGAQAHRGARDAAPGGGGPGLPAVHFQARAAGPQLLTHTPRCSYAPSFFFVWCRPTTDKVIRHTACAWLQ